MTERPAVLLSVGICVLGLATSAEAAVFLTSDSVFGVDSVVRDTRTNLDYLRLDFTTPYTYDYVVSELGAGGEFEGWSVASTKDLDTLGVSVGIVFESADPVMVAKAEELRDWFGFFCVLLSTTHEYVRGLVIEPYDSINQLAFSIGRYFGAEPNEVDFRVSGYGYRDDASEETFLVRVIPEPATLALLAIGACLPLLRRRR